MFFDMMPKYHLENSTNVYVLPNACTRDFIASLQLLFFITLPTINITLSSFLIAYHHVNSHFVIPSFLCSTCHRRSRRAYFNAEKSFHCSELNKKCIMHCGMSQIMFQRAGNFNARNDNASQKFVYSIKVITWDFTIFCHDTVETFFPCRYNI